MALMLNNFEEFYNKHDKENDHGKVLFNFNFYLQQMNEGQKPFMKQLIKTQEFKSFIKSGI